MCLPVNPRGVVSVPAGLMIKILILHIIIDSDVVSLRRGQGVLKCMHGTSDIILFLRCGLQKFTLPLNTLVNISICTDKL